MAPKTGKNKLIKKTRSSATAEALYDALY